MAHAKKASTALAKPAAVRRHPPGRDQSRTGTEPPAATPKPGNVGRARNERPELVVDVSWSDVSKVKSDVLLVGHYTGVLPQQAELALDQLVSGVSSADSNRRLVITEMSKRGAIRGDLGEVTLFPAEEGRLAAVAGMGRPGTFRVLQLRRLARTVAQVVGLLPRHQSLASVVIGSGVGNIPLNDAVEGFLGALIEALDADSSLRISRITFIERRLDRALDILQTLKQSAADLQRRSDERDGRFLKFQYELLEGAGGEISADFGCAMLLASLGMQDNADSEQGLLDTLLRRLPADVQAAVRDRLVLKQGRRELDTASLREQAMKFRLNELQRTKDRQRDPVRVAFSRSGDDIRATAITNTTTVSERVLQHRGTHAELASERLFQSSQEDLATNARRLRRLLVHADIRETLDGDDPLVIEVDRLMSLVPWEMLPAGPNEEPLGVHRPVARQLRTFYSPRPFELPRRDKSNLKALVIGDPAGEDHALPAARDEAKEVGAKLKALGVACTVLIGPPEDGTGAGLVAGYPPAGYYEVVDLLLSGDFDIVHFAGHANFDTDQADRSGWLFKDGVLTASDLEGMERPPRLIFANACLSAQVAQPNAPQMKEAEPLHFVGRDSPISSSAKACTTTSARRWRSLPIPRWASR